MEVTGLNPSWNWKERGRKRESREGACVCAAAVPSFEDASKALMARHLH